MNNAYIVPASKNYLPGLKALLNSLEDHGNKYDVVIITPDIEDEFNYSFKTKKIIHTTGDQVKDTAIERFNTEHYKEYDNICLMDADLFLTANCDEFFEIADSGWIVTGSNGMIIDFNDAYQRKYGVVLRGNTLYNKIHTTVPIFINKSYFYWFNELYNSRRVDSFDDFLYLNILGLKLELNKKMICFPPYTFTGIHHWQLKPETSLRIANNMVLDGTEMQIYMIHGKWWDNAWLQDLMPTMTKYMKDNDMGNKCQQRVKDTIQTIKNIFKKYE